MQQMRLFKKAFLNTPKLIVDISFLHKMINYKIKLPKTLNHCHTDISQKK